MKNPAVRLETDTRLGRAFGQLFRLAAVIFAVGSLLRVTIRDQIPPLSAIYYGTPVCILAALGAFLGICCLRQKRNGWALSLFVVATAWALTGCITELRSAPSSRTSEDRHVLLWNMRNGHGGWRPSIGELEEFQPDIAGLVESLHVGRRDSDIAALAEKYNFTKSWRGLTIMTRGTISEIEQGDLGANGIYQSALVTLDGEHWRVVVVDLQSNPLVSRRPSMLALRDVVEKFADESLLVMGDFNTPYDSALFKILPSALQHAFRKHGTGYAATWPWHFPVLEVDHVWFNDRIVVSDCRHTPTTHSDHRAVEVFCRRQ